MLGIIQIKTNGTIVKLNREKLDLAKAQELVKSGAASKYIEPVHLDAAGTHEYNNGKYTMFVNEEGLLCDLPYNVIASELSGQSIVGDAIIVENELSDFE